MTNANFVQKANGPTPQVSPQMMIAKNVLKVHILMLVLA